MIFWKGNSILYIVLVILAAAGASFLWSGFRAMAMPPAHGLVRRIIQILIARIEFVIGAATLIWAAILALRLLFHI
jgi:hypothetical protein